MLGAWSLCGVVEVLELLKKRSLLPASMGTFTYMPIHTRARANTHTNNKINIFLFNGKTGWEDSSVRCKVLAKNK